MEQNLSGSSKEKDDKEESQLPPPAPPPSEETKGNCSANPTECSSSSWLPEASWAVSWVNSAKEKTKSTFELIRKDIHEFSDTLQNETNSLVNNAAKKAQLFGQIIAPIPDEGKKKKGAETEGEDHLNKTPSVETAEENKEKPMTEAAQQQKGFFGINWVKQMASEVVETVHKFATEDTIGDEAKCTEEIRIGGETGGGRKTLLDQCTLLQMQNDRRTFLQKPQRGAEFFDRWLSDFKISEYNGEINLLLGENSRLREIYAELVPSRVDNFTFWHRYFFKVHVKEMEKQAQDEQLKLTVDKKGISPAGGLSPAPSNGTRDDWSMCSSSNGVATEAEESESDTAALRKRREDASTPRPRNTEEETDDWEECEGEADNETKAADKANDGQ
ncbi:hypothetical protein niasHT_022064 [Heterodera trifolii]|uniref:BSD domain-containing protein n=1 Tax=Heterodera trifolii TaxID=157864 RepID=A0ABD2JJE1_9BILA